jgi:hypothetical protein
MNILVFRPSTKWPSVLPRRKRSCAIWTPREYFDSWGSPLLSMFTTVLMALKRVWISVEMFHILYSIIYSLSSKLKFSLNKSRVRRMNSEFYISINHSRKPLYKKKRDDLVQWHLVKTSCIIYLVYFVVHFTNRIWMFHTPSRFNFHSMSQPSDTCLWQKHQSHSEVFTS